MSCYHVRQSVPTTRSSSPRGTFTEPPLDDTFQVIDLGDHDFDVDEDSVSASSGFDGESTHDELSLTGCCDCDAYHGVLTHHMRAQRKIQRTSTTSSTSPHDSTLPRVRSMDLLRGLGVLGMVLVHYMIFYGNEASSGTFLYFLMSDILGNVGAAIFLVLAGMSHALAADNRLRKAFVSGQSWSHMDEFKYAVQRALKLQSAEILMLALAWGPQGIIKWNILTLQASATIVLNVCRFLPAWTVTLLAAGIALATPALRSLPIVDFESAWGGGFKDSPYLGKFVPGIVSDPVAADLDVHWDVTSIFQSYALTGIFPLFPWLLFPLVGHVLGRRVVSNRFRHNIASTVVIGATLAVLGIGGALWSRVLDNPSVVTGYLSPLSFYPNSFTMTLVQLGCVLVVIPLAYYCYDVRNRPSPVHQRKAGGNDSSDDPLLRRVLYLTNRWALTIYVLHYPCVTWPLAVRYYLIHDGQYPIFDWMRAESALVAGVVAVVTLVGLVACLDHGGPLAVRNAQMTPVTLLRRCCGRSYTSSCRRKCSSAHSLSQSILIV